MRTIVLELHSKIFRFRKGIILVLIFLCMSAVFAKKTILNYGLETNVNFANQIAYNPRNIVNESYNWDYLKCWGVNSYLEFQKGKRFFLVGKLGYQQKGFLQPDGTVLNYRGGNKIDSPASSFAASKNKFHYITTDALVKYNLGKKLVVPFAELGLRINYLMTKRMGSSDLFHTKGNQFYDYKNFNRLALGLIAGAGLTIDNKISIAFLTDYDLTKSVNTTSLIVKNWVHTISLSFNLNAFLK